MVFIKIGILVLISVIMNSCEANKKDDLALQSMLKDIDGEGAKLRDACLESNGMKIEDLKDYESADETPQRDLCFYKCFLESIMLIDNAGMIKTEFLIMSPDVQALEEAKRTQLYECLKKADKILECNDVKKLASCFELLTKA